MWGAPGTGRTALPSPASDAHVPLGTEGNYRVERASLLVCTVTRVERGTSFRRPRVRPAPEEAMAPAPGPASGLRSALRVLMGSLLPLWGAGQSSASPPCGHAVPVGHKDKAVSRGPGGDRRGRTEALGRSLGDGTPSCPVPCTSEGPLGLCNP